MISSHPDWADFKDAPIKGRWFTRWLKSRFRYVDYPFLMAYRGFGNEKELLVQGHVFRGMALEKPRLRNSAWKNFISLIKLFLIHTVKDARVCLYRGKEVYYTQTNKDGYYEFRIKDHNLSAGWHPVKLRLDQELVEGQEEVKVKTEALIVKDFEYGLISDIDDTFLVSHVTRIWRKLYILLTKDAQTRKPFEGVVNFYSRLSAGENPFFYVSSSEWNLYDFLINFCKFYKLPKGVLQLKTIKDHLFDFFRSGFGGHEHKKHKIEKILRMYPGKKFILLGDNGQHDPYIYHSIALNFPEQVKAIYIRAVRKSNNNKTNEVLRQIDDMDIPSLQFRHSREAAEHAMERGFIKA